MTKFKKWLDHNKLYLEAAYKVLDMEEYTLRAWELAQPQWQPIETAPQDGTKFLLLGMNNEISFCRWHEEVGAWCYGGLIGPVDHECLWMPLPQPPK